jgi:hypothetical protein
VEGRFKILGYHAIGSGTRLGYLVCLPKSRRYDLAKWSQLVVETILKSIVSGATNRVYQQLDSFEERISA